MCDICRCINGSRSKPHLPENCCLLNAANCVRCGPKTHFTSQCPKTALLNYVRPNTAQPSVKPPAPSRRYCLADTNDAFVEFIKVHGFDATRDKEENEVMVRAMLPPGVELSLPPKARQSAKCIAATHTTCGIEHAENIHCRKLKVNANVKDTSK